MIPKIEIIHSFSNSLLFWQIINKKQLLCSDESNTSYFQDILLIKKTAKERKSSPYYLLRKVELTYYVLMISIFWKEEVFLSSEYNSWVEVESRVMIML